MSAVPSCADALLADWYDGALDETYDPQCYRDALDTLPEDVRIYTSAVDDISRALRERVAQEGSGTRSLSGVRRPSSAKRPVPAGAVDPAGRTRVLPLPLLVLGTLLVLVAGCAAAVTISRRRRRRSAY